MLKGVTLTYIVQFLVLCALFFIPFNSYDGIALFGEYRREGAIFFILTGLFILGLESILKKKVVIPRLTLLLKIELIFLIWILISSLINIDLISDQMMKGISGPNRLVRQLISLFIALVLVPYFFYVGIRKWTLSEIFKKIRFVFLLSLGFTTIYCLFEIAIVYLNIQSLEQIHSIYDYLPFIKVKYSPMRISSITQEPPYFAIYLITIFGWMLSYITTHKKIWKYGPAVLILILTLLSGSRTALVVVLLQALCFLMILFFADYKKEFKKIVGIVLMCSFLALAFKGREVLKIVQDKIETINFSKNKTQSVSNKSRLGIQKASLEVFKLHPITGVGYGQQSYHNRYFYPPWASTNNYEFSLWYKNPNRASFPPGFNLYVRILAETGIIGLILFLSLLFVMLKISIRTLRERHSKNKQLGIVLFISIIGFSINWLQIDSFRLFGFALILSLVYIVERRFNESNDINTKNEV